MEVNKWQSVNYLKLNAQKPEVLMFAVPDLYLAVTQTIHNFILLSCIFAKFYFSCVLAFMPLSGLSGDPAFFQLSKLYKL